MIPAVSHSALLDDVFGVCRAQRRAALIPFIVAGDPDERSSEEALVACASSGADIVELGIPYSDPIADGPAIQRAAHRALGAGMSFTKSVDLAARARQRLASTPLVCFTYFNPVFVRGIERTARELAAAGFAGIVIADLPLEEAQSVITQFGARGLAVTLLVAPTTPGDRAAAIARTCTGFVYVVSRLGVTGAHARVGEMLRARVEQLRSLTSKSLAVGFGISTPAQVADVAEFADGVIVGSALVELVVQAAERGRIVEEVQKFCGQLAVACRR